MIFTLTIFFAETDSIFELRSHVACLSKSYKIQLVINIIVINCDIEYEQYFYSNCIHKLTYFTIESHNYFQTFVTAVHILHEMFIVFNKN
jgi:hypothetical protein